MQHRRFLFLLTLALGLTAFAAAAFASGAEGGEHSLPWGNFAFRIANIVIFVGLIVKFAGKKIMGALRGRSQGIQDTLSSLEKRRLQAEKDLGEMEKRIANLEEERQQILREYREQGEAIKAALIADAQAEAALVAEHAQKTAEHELDRALEQIRAEIADLMVASAQRLLPARLTQDEQAAIVRKYLTKVVLN